LQSPLTNSNRLFSYEILGLVGSGGAGAHDLLRMAKHGRLLAWAGESQYYVEPKRLAKLGYLDARKEPGRTRERTVYTLTDKGRQALADYPRTPVTVTPLKSEPLLRLLICDLVGEEVTRESVATLHDDIADLRRRLDDSKHTAQDLPHWESIYCWYSTSSAASSTYANNWLTTPSACSPLPAGRGQALRTRRLAGLDAGNSLIPVECCRRRDYVRRLRDFGSWRKRLTA
jgi:DNA-binding PadR family transcriptional regulator